ncbi:ferritin-like protein [Ilumatobacter fluminis]|uniref:Ferritin-like protein n=1 Tax=Ilumatobacter fluminis TaxID=467091 RepID=A0A4R7I0A8_9ACTN|nr:ferritin-like domain-containing protein [Ilumatobacter fluminis]TDT15966.1 ferritin-like protein [Ilumatobacter fluminis]
MTSKQPTPLNRRELIRNGGIVLSLGAVLAACGSERSGPTNPGKIGVELLPEEESLDTTVDDAVILRTLQSLEYTTVAMHRILTGSLSGDALALAEDLIESHERHADEVGELVTQVGGTPFECSNPFMMERIVTPLSNALAGSDDPTRDALEIANGFETVVAASYQAMVEQLSDGSLRPALMTIGNESARQSSVVALATNPDAIAPELGTADESEFPIFYAIPAPFGQLTGITLVVGAPDAEGARASVTLQTPAENTFVYSGLSC